VNESYIINQDSLIQYHK